MSDKPAKLTKPQAVSAEGRRLVENLISRIRNLKDHAQAEQDLSAYIAGLEADAIAARHAGMETAAGIADRIGWTAYSSDVAHAIRQTIAAEKDTTHA